MENCIADTVGQMKNQQTAHQAHSVATYFLTLILACVITVLIKGIMVRCEIDSLVDSLLYVDLFHLGCY